MAQFYRNVVLKTIGENWDAKYVNKLKYKREYI
jgi:hypothetical protein